MDYSSFGLIIVLVWLSTLFLYLFSKDKRMKKFFIISSVSLLIGFLVFMFSSWLERGLWGM